MIRTRQIRRASPPEWNLLPLCRYFRSNQKLVLLTEVPTQKCGYFITRFSAHGRAEPSRVAKRQSAKALLFIPCISWFRNCNK